MKTTVYALDDHDVLQTYFGEDSEDHALVNFGESHCEKIFDGSMVSTPSDGDLLILPDAEGDMVEYLVIVKIFFTDSVQLIVHPRHFENAMAS